MGSKNPNLKFSFAIYWEQFGKFYRKAQALDADRKNLFKNNNYQKDKIKGLEEDIKLLKAGKLKPYQIEIV